MKSKRRKALLIFLAAAMALGIQALPAGIGFGGGASVYGATTWLDVSSSGAGAMQGDEQVAVTIDIENKEDSSFSFDRAELNFSPTSYITAKSSTMSVTIGPQKTASIVFYVDVSKSADTGTRRMTLTLWNGGQEVYNGNVGNFTIYEKLASPDKNNYVAAVEITHSTKPEKGFSSGQGNTLNLELFNKGNTKIDNAELTLTMPEGLSMDNASNSEMLGYIATGSRRSVSFPILVEDNATTKTYAITAELTGLSYSNTAVSIKKTFYIPVNGSGTSMKNVEITGINAPDQVAGEDEFVLSFQVANRNSGELKNAKVNVDVPEGLLNKTRSTFIEASIPAGGTKTYSVTMFAADGAKEKAYPIKISVSPTGEKDSVDEVIQYASVYVKATAGEKTPQLMVERYQYGGTFVQAGDDFFLELGLYNTSASHTISNIKVTVSAEDGSIIPVNSNSFYLDSLGKKSRATQTLHLSVKPNAEQKTTPLSVDMSYEDGSGNAFTSKDTISIPVMQETRLVVDDIIAPPELYAGMQTGVSVQFYNMGKTILNNLRITAEGDFDTPESTSYFAGNMESGKSDSYDFSFIPRKGGSLEGKIIFSYEDASGDVQTLERPFSFQVMDEMPAFNDGMPPEDPAAGGGHKKLWIILGVIVVLAGAGVFAWRKIRKRKKQREMEIDE